jgi:hypothetical protein
MILKLFKNTHNIQDIVFQRRSCFCRGFWSFPTRRKKRSLLTLVGGIVATQDPSSSKIESSFLRMLATSFELRDFQAIDVLSWLLTTMSNYCCNK